MMWFFLIFFSVYGLANYYVLRRFLSCIPAIPESLKIIFITCFILAAVSYIAAKTILVKYTNSLYDITLWVGSFWFAILLYSFLFWLTVDTLKLIRLTIIYVSNRRFNIPTLPPQYILLAGLLIVLGVALYGFLNAGNIKTKYLSLSIPNPLKAGTTLKILYFSDSHATAVNNGRIFDQILRISGTEKPDLILMGGDVVDDRANQLYRIGIDKKLLALHAPYGIFTCPGNHEYINGKNEMFEFLTKNGVSVLADSVVTIKDLIQILGRDDMSNRSRKQLPELVQTLTPNLPVIMLDHQPFHLELTEKYGINLQLSGHTHHGQMFPFNLITSKIYEVSRGYKQKGKSNIYVSSGVGTWGSPVRTGSDSEVLILNITFTDI